jgi:protease YdgD
MSNAQLAAFRVAVKHATALLCGVAALAGAAALAGIAASEELSTGDSEQHYGPPWTAIGHVNVGGYRTALRCSGVLVRPNVVLTAAHCLIDPWKRTAFSVDRIHFLQHVKGASWIAHSRAKCLHFLPGQQFSTEIAGPLMLSRNAPLKYFGRDVAAIVLNDNLNAETMHFANEGEVRPGVNIVQASYPADRRYKLSVDSQCRLLSAVSQLWLTSCYSHAASSGGPIFARIGGVLKLAAIIVGTAERRFTIAVPSSTWIASTDDTCP